jgi:DNA polymerase II small subunit
MDDREAMKRELIERLLQEGRLVTPEELEQLLTPPATAAPAPQPEPASAPLLPAPTVPGLSPARVQVVKTYAKPSRSRTVQDFVSYFTSRQAAMERILQGHGELKSPTSCGRLATKRGREAVSLIGIVNEKDTTKTGSIVLRLEDRTGSVKVIVSGRAPDALAAAKDLVHDEVIGVMGTMGDGVVFANSIILPDVPISEPRTCPEEAYAALLSDIHVGSKLFLADAFERFIAWTLGEWGPPEARRMAERLRYVLIAGDAVDGVGIYPSQDKELAIPDIYGQYEECARLLARIPGHIALVLSPGNHDAMRLSEPQLALGSGFSAALAKLPNLTLVSNPALVNIHATGDFPGLNVLMYHGYSYDYYGDMVESIRTSGRHISDRVELIMRFLIQRRHLAPSHGSTLYIPDAEQDPLIIDPVPDIFVSGHIHKTAVGRYRGVLLVSGSCFQAKTAFQEKVGHDPNPGVVPVINLKTGQVTLIDFTQAELKEPEPPKVEAQVAA